MIGSSRYDDRPTAGRALADEVVAVLGPSDPTRTIVLGLARGGVPVAAPVAERLGAPLDVLVVRKVGAPGHEELAIGAVTGLGGVVLDESMIERLGIGPADVAHQVDRAERELVARETRLRAGAAARPVAGCDVVLVDDGLATGSTMRAAVVAQRRAGAARVVVAVPVGAPSAVAALAAEVDVLVCPRQPSRFRAVGEWYRRFDATPDDEVLALVAGDRRPDPSSTANAPAANSTDAHRPTT